MLIISFSLAILFLYHSLITFIISSSIHTAIVLATYFTPNLGPYGSMFVNSPSETYKRWFHLHILSFPM